MTDWQDANFTVTTNQVCTPSKDWENYIWRSTWPWEDNQPS